MAAFTVKATYHSETRKFSFPGSSFPTYGQLYNQLYRVFPISHSFHLSKLQFSPSSSLNTRILIAREIHSSKDYDLHVAPYRGGSWQTPVLRFTVIDNTPHDSSVFSLNDSLSNDVLDTPRSHSVASSTAATTSASSHTVVAADCQRPRGRQELVDRIRGHMNNRLSLHAMPLTPPTSSRPSSTADSWSRPVSLASEPDGWRPLPVRPSSRGESAAISHTARPSLFDLLANTPSSQSVPRANDTATGFTMDPLCNDDVASPFKDTRPYRRRFPLDRPFSSPSPQSSLNDVVYSSPPRLQCFVAPPPPILFSQPSHSSLRAELHNAQANNDTPKYPGTSLNCVPQSVSLTSELAQSEQPAQSEPRERIKEPGWLSSRVSMDETSPLLPRPMPEICSVSEVKADVEALKESFKNFKLDFERDMVKAFGEGWNHTPAIVQAPQAHSPSPPSEPRPWTCYQQVPPPPPLPMPPRRTMSSPPPPPRPHFRHIAPPPALPSLSQRVLPTPPPIRFVPPPPPPFVRGGQAVQHLAPSSADVFVLPPQSCTPSVNPVQNPPIDSMSKGDGTKRDPDIRVHKNVRCDFCGKKDIEGIRYRCLQCLDFDWCSACMASPAAWEAHAATHSFFPIRWEEDFAHFDKVKDIRRQQVHLHIVCDGCNQQNFCGVRHKCLQCDDYDLCDNCVSSPTARQAHDVTHVFFPIDTPGNKQAYNEVRLKSSSSSDLASHSGVHCDGCSQYPIAGVRHKCLDCEDYDLCTSCLSNSLKRQQHNVSHSFFPIETPSEYPYFNRIRDSHRRASAEFTRNNVQFPIADDGPLLHKNIFCDVCTVEIIGVRHKCLDCPDYDMCAECLATPQLREQHHMQHQFFAIDKPGEVVVHTVFSGDGERVPERHSQQPSPRVDIPRPNEFEAAVHNARCDMCDSRIRGDRFKCLNCPDYDLCQVCYRIAPEQHPDHGFVKISEPAFYLSRDAGSDPIHNAYCNVCDNQIKGVRYKCVHESCRDFDLCADCEALPIPVHPAHHPLLKLRSPGVVVPSALRPEHALPIPMNPARTTSAEDYHYVEPSVPITHEVVEPSFMNAPAPLPALPLPDFTPAIPSCPQVTSSHMGTPLCLYPYPYNIAYDHFDPPIPQRLFSPTNLVVPSRSPSPPYLSPRWFSSLPISDSTSVDISGPAEPHVQVASVTPEVVQDHIQAASPAPLFDVSAHDGPSPNNGHNAFEGFMGGISTPSDVLTSNSDTSVPKLGLVNSEWSQLWPELSTMLHHLLPPQTVQPSLSTNPFQDEPSREYPEIVEQPLRIEEPSPPVFEESPLVGEPLLCRPLMPERSEQRFTAGRSLSDLINSVHVSPICSYAPSPEPLLAVFVSDSNIPVGQIFPPGAEFVKSWRMRNEGTADWPETTELLFVAGDRMTPHNNSVAKILVGSVKAGEEIELVSGEMKAPEVPGKYVSSWRLSDGAGNLFGQSIWVDITVAEMTECASDESLAASSVIMPHSATQTALARSSISLTVSSPSSEFDSSASLLDVLSTNSSDDEDNAIYQDSRSQIVPTPDAQDIDYVMLFDSSSEED